MVMSNSPKDAAFGTRSALIVDDSHLMRQLLRSLLRDFGFNLIGEAADGSEALEALGIRNYDVVLCDWMMEPTDGYNFVSQLRQHTSEHLKGLPVIMLTSVGDEPQVRAARDIGVTEYLIKPVSADKLRKRLLAVFNRPRDFVTTESYVGPDRRRRQETGSNTPARRLSDELAALPETATDTPVDDRPTGRDYVPVLKAELRRLGDLCREIEDENGAAAEPWIVMARIAHDLKGQAATFGFQVIAEIAARLEKLSRPVARDTALLRKAMERRIGSTQRHVDALRLVFEQGVTTGSPETDALLERLDRAIERVNRDSAVKAPAAPEK